jgi:hypothetical protein
VRFAALPANLPATTSWSRASLTSLVSAGDVGVTSVKAPPHCEFLRVSLSTKGAANADCRHAVLSEVDVRYAERS